MDASKLLLFATLSLCFAQSDTYDLLLQGGHVVDGKNNVDAVRDVAIKDGRIAAVQPHIDSSKALKAINVGGMYVSPGLVDIHVHVYAGTGEPRSYAGDQGVYPDGFTFRSGVTSVADAGSSGWRNFEDFKQRVIDRAKTRVFAFLNIVGHGMRGAKFENNLEDMDPKPAAEMAMKYKETIVGFKTAHFAGPEWAPVENAVKAGTTAGIPVMVDFGTNRPERPMAVLVTQKLRPGDIYTHMYSGLRNEQDESGHVNAALWQARKRGVIMDVGHGSGSFAWRIAYPAIKEGFLPDSISTDLHVNSMNSALHDMTTLMSKFLAMGMKPDDIIVRSTWNPAREIHHEELGNLSAGSVADIAVLSIQKGSFGFDDMYGARLKGDSRFVCELTIKDGKVVYDLNAISRSDWTTLPSGYRQTGDARWDALHPPPPRTAH